jgi:putative ABC transport system ATP-binding protein
MADSIGRSDIWLTEVIFETSGVYQIIAPSGTGKTTFAHILFGIRHDYSGVVRFNSDDISHYSRTKWEHVRRELIAMVFQGLGLFPELTLVENIMVKQKLTKYKSQDEIAVLIERLGLHSHKHKPAGILSFGQQQRVAFLRALCQPFSCILLDEPFSHLDHANTNICLDILHEEIRARNAMALITSLEKHNYSPNQYVLNL